MTHPVFEKYRSLAPLNDEAVTNALLTILVKTPRERLSALYGASAMGGRFYMIRHESQPGKVLEYVPDVAQDSSVSTLYAEHPIFERRQRLIDAREEIVSAIDHLLLAIPGTTTVLDEGRGKQVHLLELGTAQLLDVLNHFATH
jgi:hypothetical protein